MTCSNKRGTLRLQQTTTGQAERPESEDNMSHMTSSQRSKCHAIIHSASASAGAVGAGLAQIPCSDNAVITPIQLTMTIALGKIFGIELTESSARAAVASAAAAMVGRTASQLLLGWIPIAGNIINACTAASITETVGWIIAKEFAKEVRATAYA